MIETKLLKDSNPAIVYHRVSELKDEIETIAGIESALEVIRKVNITSEGFNLVLDMREYEIFDLSMHKLWAIGFKESDEVKSNVRKVALIGSDSEKLTAEKELMKSDSLNIFTNLESALLWLDH